MPPITTYGSIDGLYLQGIRAEALTSFTAAQKGAALEGASRMIDSFMTGFTLPFTAVGTDMDRAANVIAAYDLMSSRGLNPEGTDQNLRLRYEDVMKWLAMVAAGTVVPVVTDSTPETNEQFARPGVISSSSRGYSTRGLDRTTTPRNSFQSD